MPRAPSRRSRRALIVVGVVVVLLAAGWVRSNAGGIRQAERLSEALKVGASAARLAHEVQRERDLSGFFVASGRQLYYGTMLSQRIWVNQASKSFETQASRLEPRLGSYDEALGRSLRDAAGRVDGIRLFREHEIDAQGAALGTAEALRWYDLTVERLLGVVAEVGRVAKGSPLDRDLQAVIALARYKEAVAMERSYLYAAYGCGGFAGGTGVPSQDEAGGGVRGATAGGQKAPHTATGTQRRALAFQEFTAILERKAAARAGFDRIARPEFREQLARVLSANQDVASAEAIAADVRRDPAAAGRASKARVKDWFFDMNSQVDTLRRVENQLFADIASRTDATRNGAELW
jgi:Nitrate and nitrite sensing